MAVAATSPVLWQLDPPAGESSIDLIAEHYPLLLGRAGGQLQPKQLLAMIRFFDEAGQRAERDGRALVTIFDTSEASMPTPLIREMLIDWLSDRPRSPQGVTFVVAPSALMRGVIASLKWATGRGVGIEVVAELSQAAAGAVAYLRANGLPVPEPLRQACVE